MICVPEGLSGALKTARADEIKDFCDGSGGFAVRDGLVAVTNEGG